LHDTLTALIIPYIGTLSQSARIGMLVKQWQTKYAKNKNKNSKLSSPVPGPSGTGHQLGIAAFGKLL